ncbi:hypothetical protein MKX01_014175 [Papaver californicum]|nr:hypothetical protein MKX01_014175 [Papaver californicum]
MKKKEVNKPGEKDSTGTQTTIVIEDIQEDTFENNNAFNDHCTKCDWEKPIDKNSQEDLEVRKPRVEGLSRVQDLQFTSLISLFKVSHLVKLCLNCKIVCYRSQCCGWVNFVVV